VGEIDIRLQFRITSGSTKKLILILKKITSRLFNSEQFLSVIGHLHHTSLCCEFDDPSSNQLLTFCV
jgi:hypothetical protein